MSGIETVGLILGSLPLLISTMEHYANGVSTMNRYRRYELELQRLINILNVENIKLLNTCEKLLTGLAPPSQIGALLKEPLGQLWNEPGLQASIQFRLWRSYEIFIITISEVLAASQEISRNLGLEPKETGHLPAGVNSRRATMKCKAKKFVKKMSFSLQKATYDEQILRIKDSINSLETLTAQNLELEYSRKKSSHGQCLPLLQDCFKSVYRALQHGLGIRCSNSHVLHLALALRPAYITNLDYDETVSQGLSFRLAIQNHHEESTPASALSCNHVVVRRLATVAPPTPSTALPPSRSPSPIPPGILSSGTPGYKKSGRNRKSVSFLGQGSTLPGSSSITANSMSVKITGITSVSVSMGTNSNTNIVRTDAGVTNSGTTTTTATTTVNVAQGLSLLPTPISDGSAPALLCQTPSSSLDYYGHVVDATGGMKYGVYPPDADDSLRGLPLSTVSLRQALEATKAFGKGKATAVQLPFLTVSNRFALALAVSSSVLQLHDTPWLGGPELTCDDILFLHKYHHSGDGGIDDSLYAQAFVAASVPVRPEPSPAGANCADNDGISSGFGLALPWLGVLLVELILGRVVRRSVGTILEATAVFDAAEKLLSAVTETGGKEYADAARWCLQQYGCRTGVEHGTWQEKVYQNLVAPLEKTYNYI
ncbi:hypothetical protein F503_03934 [Ophiostoma piceae UAMH 11346]|uniref:DUF7580 domain-containing protein n=1 Tax=Ophiostoma piceae (strain UAMH 11346) TaxID=1262450 RepID=S3BMA9_OPHP1|nr:hypothetical protein F503_03934 [Ophiostoma piceae UAMH 11346]